MPSGFFVWETIRCRLDAFLWYAMHISKEGFSLPKILIVEDELPIADLIRLTLKSAGYLCDHAPDGDQAADLAAAGNYDLALVDVMLPRTDLRHRPVGGGRPGEGAEIGGRGLYCQAL